MADTQLQESWPRTLKVCPSCGNVHGGNCGWMGQYERVEVVPLSVAENLVAALERIGRKLEVGKVAAAEEVARDALAEFRAAYPAKEGSQE